MSEWAVGIIELMKRRLDNSFLFAYFISWPIYNYKIFFVLFSKYDLAYKFTYIDYVLYSPGSFFWQSSSIPLVVAIAYTFAWPIVEGVISFLVNYINFGKLWLLIWQAKQKPVTRIEKDEFLKQFEVDKLRYKSLFEKSDKTHEELKLKYINDLSFVEGRLKDMVLARIGDAAKLDANAMRAILRGENIDHNELILTKDRLSSFKYSNEIRLLRGKFKELPINREGNYTADWSWIQRTVDLTEHQSIEILEILHVLDLISAPNRERKFSVVQESVGSHQWNALNQLFGHPI